MSLVPWAQGTTKSHRLGLVGQKGSYPDIQSLIDIQETEFLKENVVIKISNRFDKLTKNMRAQQFHVSTGSCIAWSI